MPQILREGKEYKSDAALAELAREFDLYETLSEGYEATMREMEREAVAQAKRKKPAEQALLNPPKIQLPQPLAQ